MILSLSDVKKSYQQGSKQISVLQGLDLELNPSEIVAVIGQSGSGKSTLLSLVAGFIKPDQGRIQWQNQPDTQNWGDREWSEFRKQNLGFVFQNYQLISYLTAIENAALPLKLLKREDAISRAQELLEPLGLAARGSHLPNQLSGGECQRVAIARAIIHRPRLVLADEPTGSLDETTGEQVLDLMFSILRIHSLTAMIVTHSPDIAKRCDRVLRLHQGALCPA